MSPILWLAAAYAQAVPETSVQLWRMPIDAERTLWTEDAAPAPDGWYAARATASYMRDPLVYVWEDGEIDEVLRDAVGVDLSAGYTVGRLRFGAAVPLWLHTAGDEINGGAGLGDLVAEVRGIAVDGRDAPIGVAGTARLLLPTTTARAPVGNRGFAMELVAIGDKEIGAARLSANLGARIQPKADLADDGVLDERLFARIGGGLPLGEAAGVSLDLGGELNLAGLPAEGTPIELIAGGWYRVGDLVLRGGLGRGLSTGIGAPQLRALLSVGFEPERVWDLDLDGIVDEVDGCPAEPEDVDLWRDDDGCPDPLTEVRIRVVDDAEAPVPGATLALQGVEHPVPDVFVVELAPGSYPVHADGTEHRALDATLTVSDGPPAEFALVLDHDPIVGTLSLSVTDAAGAPIGSVATIADLPATPLPDGRADIVLAPGVYTVALTAAGYLPTSFPIELYANEKVPFTVVLQPRRVKVTRERLVITDKIYFEFNKAIIKPDSYGLLEEIAQTLQENPDILEIRVEGHTDSRGSASANLKLSTARAAAVRTWLVEHGIDPTRLVSAGFGEGRPVDPAENEVAWELNRRVEFVMVRWAP